MYYCLTVANSLLTLMKKLLFFLSINILLSSCASILNRKKIPIVVYSEKPVRLVINSDTLSSQVDNRYNAIPFEVYRSKDSLRFVLLSDSLPKSVSIASKNSTAYYFNYYPSFLPGLLIDKSRPKRFTYRKILSFDENLNQNNKITTGQWIDFNKQKIKMNMKSEPGRKGRLYWNISYPFIYPTFNYLKPIDQARITSDNTLGLSSGFDYYYKSNKFINFNIAYSFSVYNNNDLFSNLDERIGSIKDHLSTTNLSLSTNHRFEYFSYGYGLSYSIIDWSKDVYFESAYVNTLDLDPKTPQLSDNIDEEHRSARYSTLGLVFNGYFHFTDWLSLGVVYKPSFIRLKPNGADRFCYEHQISVDLAFRFSLF